MTMDYSLLGAGLGSLPSLWQLISGNTPMAQAQNTAGNNGNFQGTGLNAAQVAAVSPNPAQATAAYNFANSGGQSTTNPQWKFGAPTMSPANADTGITPTANAGNGSTNPLAALAAAFGGGNANGTGTGTNNNPLGSLSSIMNLGAATTAPPGATQLATPKVQGPQGGGGPTSLASAITPATTMAAPTMPSGISGAPLGPAASNPMLLSLLRQRLGMGSLTGGGAGGYGGSIG